MGTRLLPNENETGYRTMAAMSMAAFWLCAASILVTVVRGIAVRSSPGADCLHVNTTTHRLVDNYGRERYFHGVNVVMKRPPWLPRMDKFDPRSSFVEKDMQVLSDLGLNGIRYSVYSIVSRESGYARICAACSHWGGQLKFTSYWENQPIREQKSFCNLTG